MMKRSNRIHKHKILLLTPSLKHRAGVADFCRMLLGNLDSNFHAERLEIGNRPGNKMFLGRFLYLIHNVYELITRLESYSYDIIHINPSLRIYSLLRDSLYMIFINGLGYRNRTVVFFHGWDENLAEKILNSSFCRSMFIRIYKEAGVIFVLHNRGKKQLINMGINQQKIRVTTTMYERISKIEEYPSKKIGEKVNILFMSRFVKGKGVYIAANVAKLLVENGHNEFRLTFAGDGPLMPGLRKFIKENGLSIYVDILGYVRGREKEKILEEGGIFLFPTQLKEGCPVVIVEAMGAGYAIVSTNRGAIPEIIENGKNGYICNSRDPKVFYESVKRLLDDRELLSNMQKINRRKAWENYEASSYMKSIEEVYLSIVNNNTKV